MRRLLVLALCVAVLPACATVNDCLQHPEKCIPVPVPTPTPTPTPEPTPTPTPVPTPTPAPTPTPTPTPSEPSWETHFPVRFPTPFATLGANNKRYGNGMDFTLLVYGDDDLCVKLHGPEGHSPCHFDSVIWTDSAQRADYEGLVMAGARDGDSGLPLRPLGPVWEYRAAKEVGRCHDDQVHVNTSCDHFGNTVDRDDPQTKGTFEGKPSWLQYQRDEFGPYAGFFMVPQTSGKDFGTQIRGCTPNGESCGPWYDVNWK